MDKEILQALSQLFDEKLKPINDKLESLEQGQKRIEEKLDIIYNHVSGSNS